MDQIDLSQEAIMTEEIVKSITEAEEKAAQIKRDALDRSAQIVAEATAKAACTESSATEVCKAYRETQIKNAHAEAERLYNETVENKQAEAKEYCTRVLEGADSVIGNIVGRIIGGDC